jgi:aconitase A
VRVRVDTPVEAAYIAHGGILPYVFRRMMHDAFAA